MKNKSLRDTDCSSMLNVTMERTFSPLGPAGPCRTEEINQLSHAQHASWQNSTGLEQGLWKQMERLGSDICIKRWLDHKSLLDDHRPTLSTHNMILITENPSKISLQEKMRNKGNMCLCSSSSLSLRGELLTRTLDVD